MKRTILSICGGSGSGKSILAKHLVERLGAEFTVRIPTDYYLKPNPYPSLAKFMQHPLQYDWELLQAVLDEADGTSITTPIYDFTRFQRLAETGGRPFVLRPIIIMDAMVPYPSADLSFLVQCPMEERQRRIIERDRHWHTQVIKYWDLHQTTLAAMLCERQQFDLMINGMASLAENVERIFSLLENSSRTPSKNSDSHPDLTGSN